MLITQSDVEKMLACRKTTLQQQITITKTLIGLLEQNKHSIAGIDNTRCNQIHEALKPLRQALHNLQNALRKLQGKPVKPHTPSPHPVKVYQHFTDERNSHFTNHHNR